MEQILETLAPLALLIALGSVLAHIRFLGEPFIADLNRLAFWIALPALIFTSASAGGSSGNVCQIFGVMALATLLITLVAWAVSYALRMPDSVRGTLEQSAFRGNLAYIGVPVLANSYGPGAPQLSAGIIAMVLTMALYNILAVVVLQASQHSVTKTDGRKMVLTIATNPLLLSGVLGLIVPLLHITLPLFLNRTLQSLGSAAVPIALLCIGGSLVIVPMRGKQTWIITAALLKVAVLPVIVYFLGRLAGFDAGTLRIALVFAACPTAAASFVMARQMGGDEALASGSIALSTLLSAIPLSAALWLAS